MPSAPDQPPSSEALASAPALATEADAIATVAPEPATSVSSELDPASGEHCLNCGAALVGPFCHQCGQPHKHFIRAFWRVLGDLISSALDFDNRAWRTLWLLLFDPGRLSRDYVAGRRHAFVPPLRLYLIISLSVMLLASLNASDDWVSFSNGDRPVVAVDDGRDPSAATSAAVPEADGAQTASVPLVSGEVATAPASVADGVQVGVSPDASGRLRLMLNGQPFDGETVRLDWFEQDHPKVNAALNRYLTKQADRILTLEQNSDQFIDALLSRIAQAMFVLMPLFALVLALFYLFDRRFLMEHVIVSLHLHCFWFLWLGMVLMGGALIDLLELWDVSVGWLRALSTPLLSLILIWLGLGSAWMLHRYYQQRWWLLLLKLPFLLVGYLLLFSFAAVVVLMLSLLTF